MKVYSLSALRDSFPALDALYRDDRAVLHQADAFVDRIRAVMNSRVRTMEKGGVRSDRLFLPRSEVAREHPEISAGLDRARRIPLIFDLDGLRSVDRMFTNTGRGLLSRQFTVEEMRTEERLREAISEGGQQERDAAYERALELADYGGQPTEAVVVHGDEWTDETGVLACPVPVGWSQYRLARYMNPECRMCFWCCGVSRVRLDDYLLVSCGAVLRMFPTCPSCRYVFDDDTQFTLSWKIMSDRWEAEVGYPSDEWY